MNVGEATRQAAIESQRAWNNEFGEQLSFFNESEQLELEVDETYEELRKSWETEQQARANARARS